MTRPPNRQETLLLRAALDRAPEALAAWEAWRLANDFDDLQGESVKVVPLLYRNLSKHGVPPDQVMRYASVYRHTWAANRLAFKACAKAIGYLSDAGIDTLLLKGAAVTLLHYRDSGVRAMSDVDVLVPKERAVEAADILRARGWKGAVLDEAEFATQHALGLRDDYGHGIDLHWYASAEAQRPGCDTRFWEASVPVVFEGVPTRALAPTDLLYNVLAHGFSSFARHVRWAADAMTLLRTSAGGRAAGAGERQAAIDWTRLASLAEERRLVLPVRESLTWLVNNLDAPVPHSALQALANAKVAVVDRLEYAHRMSDAPFSPDKVLVRLWCWYRRTTDARGVDLALGFPRWLAMYYRRGGVEELPPKIYERVMRLVRGDIKASGGRRASRGRRA